MPAIGFEVPCCASPKAMLNFQRWSSARRRRPRRVGKAVMQDGVLILAHPLWMFVLLSIEEVKVPARSAKWPSA